MNNGAANKFTITKMDVTRIGKNFAYRVRQLPWMTEDQYVAAGKATLEHHFDNHELCGSWCRQRDYQDNNQQYYRTKTKDAALYNKLQQIVQRFITFDQLKEVAHGMDTDVNESFNNTFSWLAPRIRCIAALSLCITDLLLVLAFNPWNDWVLQVPL